MLYCDYKLLISMIADLKLGRYYRILGLARGPMNAPVSMLQLRGLSLLKVRLR